MRVEIYEEDECIKSEEFKTPNVAHSYACHCVIQLLKKGFKIALDHSVNDGFGFYTHLKHPKSGKNVYVTVKEGVVN